VKKEMWRDFSEMDLTAQFGVFGYFLRWYGEREREEDDLRNRIDDTRFLDVVSKILFI
jgi:hypothetical protein